MRHRLSFALISIALACEACLPVYQPPAITEPYALVKVRSLFHGPPEHFGEKRDLRIDVDHKNWVWSVDSVSAQGSQVPWIRAVRARPGRTHWRFNVAFWHDETRTEQKTEDVDVPYTVTESYTEFGVSKTRTVTKHRRETKTVTEAVHVTVHDDSCRIDTELTLQDKRVYLLQYTYVGAGICRMTCLEQYAPQLGAAAQFRPCSPTGRVDGT